MTWERLLGNPALKVEGLDQEAEEGTGADVIIVAPASTLQDASPELFENPPRRPKRTLDHPPPELLYGGMEKFLVRTALVRAPGWDKGARVTVRSPDDIAHLCRHLVHADQEHIATITMDAGNQVLAIHEASIGITSSSMTSAQHLSKVALLSGATSLAMVHNHPSGNPKPSADDEVMTRKIKATLECIGITFLDHVIVGYDGWYSFEAGGSTVQAWSTMR